MKNGSSLAGKLLLLAAAGCLAACASAPSRFYTLAPIASAQAKHPSGGAASQLAIKIEPVEIPDYLNRPQIVTREGLNGVKLAEFDRWAGSLSENISTVLAEDLAQLLGSDHVLVNEGPPLEKPDYTVAMRLLRLDCLPGDRVLLKAQWRLFSRDGKREVSHVSDITQKITDSEYGTMVAAVNQALAQVSREIAAEIVPPAATGPRLQGAPEPDRTR